MKLSTVVAAMAIALAASPIVSTGSRAQAVREVPVEVEMVRVGPLEIAKPWARATPPGQRVSAVYFTARNTSDKPVSIVSASSPVAAKVVLHTMEAKKGFPEMVTVDRIEIPPGEQVELQPGGYHLMLVSLNTTLRVGKTYDISIELSDGTKADLKALVWDAGMVRVLKE